MAIPVREYFVYLRPGNALHGLSNSEKRILISFLCLHGVPVAFDKAYEPLEELSALATKANTTAAEIRLVVSQGPLAKVFGSSLQPFRDLPGLLEEFSSFIGGFINELAGKPGHKAKLARRQFLIMASEFVRQRLGRYFDGDLAELAQAVNPGTDEIPSETSADAIRNGRNHLRKQYPRVYEYIVRQVRRGLERREQSEDAERQKHNREARNATFKLIE